MTSTSTKTKTRRPYGYRPGSDGCDETWDIYSRKTGAVIAAVPFWTLREECKAIARKLTSAPDAAALLIKITANRIHLTLYGEFAEVLDDALGVKVKILDIESGWVTWTPE